MKRLLITLAAIAILILAGLLVFPGRNTSYNGMPPSSVPSSGESQLIFVGDVMLSRSVGALMAAKDDYNWPFEKIADFLSGADIAVANLETPISSRGVNVGSIYSFRSDPRSAGGLKFAGIDIVSLANNHAWDWGMTAFGDTMTHLASAGISYIGAGYNAAEAHAGVVKDVKGTKIGFLAYTNLLPKSIAATVDRPGLAIFDEAEMIRDIQAMRPRADIVTVSFHFGDEYQTIHNALQERMALAAIDAGADLVIGHHPHVVQDIERYRDKWIVYSLGNFVFDQNFSVATQSGLAVRITIRDKKIMKLEEVPIKISDEYQASL